VIRAAAGSEPARTLAVDFIVRGGERPGFCVVGDVDEAARCRLEELSRQLVELTEVPFVYVDYHRAEDACVALAGRLRERFSASELDEARFVAIPRGGHIVLGLLSLAMGLRHEQLPEVSQDPDRLTIFVDDCALSGHRLRSTLREAASRRVAFAVLYAAEPLCHAVESTEERVEACVAAHALLDVGPTLFGDGYQAWKRRWATLTDGDLYWVGRPQNIAFSWKEPDRSFFNQVTERREPAWRVVPPQFSMTARLAPFSRPVHVQPVANGPLRPAPDVFFAELDDDCVVVIGIDGAVRSLDPVASAIWNAIVEHGCREAAVELLVACYEVDRPRLESDVQSLVGALIDEGLLVDDLSA
jgi:hypothetical protein